MAASIYKDSFVPGEHTTKELGWLGKPGSGSASRGEAAPIRQPDGFVEKAIWRLLDSVTYTLTNFPAAGGQ